MVNMKMHTDQLAAQCESVSGLLKAIAHPQRLKILCLLADQEKTVSELERDCDASQSSVSQYLAKMKSEGLLSARRAGQHMYYRIESKELLKLMRAMQKIFCA